MSAFPEYDQYDALGLAAAVARKDVTPVELCEEAIGRIEAINPTLNAVICRMDEQARNTARHPLPSGPFTGVPFYARTWCLPSRAFP